MITIFQFLEHLSDRQAADAVRARIDWKYALGLELADPGFHFSVLTEFRARIAFIECGEYERLFGIQAVVIAYATSGAGGEFTEGRRKAMCSWTMEVLREEGREDWASVFRFGSVSFRELYESGLFEKRVWYRPDKDAPVLLLGA